VPDVKPKADDGIDPSTLPPITAPPSHPAIDPTATGMLEGRPIYEVDIAALAEKAWRRPGSDISDWFNYGFDEISWEAYCYRRRELGDLAAVLKTNVVVRARVSSFYFCKAYLVECRIFPACLRISSHSFLRSCVQWS
jgi:pre-mRNA 3'-end-processing factor FIP1